MKVSDLLTADAAESVILNVVAALLVIALLAKQTWTVWIPSTLGAIACFYIAIVAYWAGDHPLLIAALAVLGGGFFLHMLGTFRGSKATNIVGTRIAGLGMIGTAFASFVDYDVTGYALAGIAAGTGLAVDQHRLGLEQLLIGFSSGLIAVWAFVADETFWGIAAILVAVGFVLFAISIRADDGTALAALAFPLLSIGFCFAGPLQENSSPEEKAWMCAAIIGTTIGVSVFLARRAPTT